ncbi:MAG: hypothetical protein RJB11_1645 [Planctomycetota bacterium]
MARKSRIWLPWVLSNLIAFLPSILPALAQDSFDLPPIRYSESKPTDPVSVLKRKLASGEVVLEHDEKYGVLPSLLKELKIPVESQVLVFSKTSLQIHKISPTNPRALYFNDSVYVGYVPGSSILELAANDPVLGAVFYTLEVAPKPTQGGPSSIEETKKQVELVRDRGQCLSCHATTRTENVPGYLVRSIYPDSTGRPRTGSSSYTTDYRSLFETRWGGWYVTGTHGQMRHLGNLFALDRNDPQKVDVETGANLSQLPARVRPGLHLTPHSDLVALMVLEHQIRVHNLITKASYETRQSIAMDESMNKALDRPSEFRTESTQRRIETAARALADALLMRDEPPLRDQVHGTSGFEKSFSSTGPADSNGRSLRQLDLQSRLFRYRLSYLIYTPEFQGLPKEVIEPVQARLRAALGTPEYKAELEILQATLPGWLVMN